MSHLIILVYIFFKHWTIKKHTENSFALTETDLSHVDFSFYPSATLLFFERQFDSSVINTLSGLPVSQRPFRAARALKCC